MPYNHEKPFANHSYEELKEVHGHALDVLASNVEAYGPNSPEATNAQNKVRELFTEMTARPEYVSEMGRPSAVATLARKGEPSQESSITH